MKDDEIIYNKQSRDIEKQRNKEIEKQEAGQSAEEKKIVSSGEYSETKNSAGSDENTAVKTSAGKTGSNNIKIKAVAVKAEEILSGSYEGKTVKIEGRITDKSGNVFFVDDGSGIVKISVPPKIFKANYAKMKAGGNVSVSGNAGKISNGYKILAKEINEK